MADRLLEALQALADDIDPTTPPAPTAYRAWSRGRRRRRWEQVGSTVAVAAVIALLVWLVPQLSSPTAAPPAHPAGQQVADAIPERLVKDARPWQDLPRMRAGDPPLSAVLTGFAQHLYGVRPDGSTVAIPGLSGDPTDLGSAPALSPDGTRLAGYTTGATNTLAIVDLDGSGRADWPDVHATGTVEQGGWWAGPDLSWSPGSDRVASCVSAASSDGTAPDDLVIAGAHDFRVIPRVCDRVVGWLDPDTVAVVREEAGNTELPDPHTGATLVFSAVSVTEGDTTLLEVHGLTAQDVDRGPVVTDGVVLSPDGTRVASLLGPDRHLAVLSVDGTGSRDDWAPVPASDGVAATRLTGWTRTGVWVSHVESGALVVSRAGRSGSERSIVADPGFVGSAITATDRALDAPRTRVAPWGTSTAALSWVPVRTLALTGLVASAVLGLGGLVLVRRRRGHPSHAPRSRPSLRSRRSTSSE